VKGSKEGSMKGRKWDREGREGEGKDWKKRERERNERGGEMERTRCRPPNTVS